jgi:hypothetical protein
MGKKSGSGSGVNNPDHISQSLKPFFGLKDLNSIMRIRDPEWKYSDPESGMENGRIRDLGSGKTSRIRNTVYRYCFFIF